MEIFILTLEQVGKGGVLLVQPFLTFEAAEKGVETHLEVNKFVAKSTSYSPDEDPVIWDWRVENSQGESLYYVITKHVME